MKSNVLIKGKLIYLRPPTEKDVYGNWWTWLNDAEVTRNMNKGYDGNTAEKQMQFFKSMENSKTDCVLAVCTLNGDQHIGTTAIHQIREENNRLTGNFGILIGEKEFWGKGIGSEVWELMVKESFESLGLQTIITKIFSTNIPSLKIAEKIGFKIIGTKDNEFEKDGQPIKRYVLQLNKEDYEGSL
ncbi:MAG: GNAT family N-acetyltransferase [Candidatus Omnitrophica bacterium]|nr:GNAT family N-acetyltransferase [Candidatus Omnitrophota bacterium]